MKSLVNVRRDWLAWLVLGGLVLLVYGQTTSFDFVNFDDPIYIYRNPNLKSGLSWTTLKWALTTFYFSNWHPLTWVSYLSDVSLFGFNPHAFHAVNVGLHLGNTLLVFLTVNRYTKTFWPSWWTAVFFAVHPLHVESVAWISERKDLLAGCFWLLTMLAYERYARTSLWRFYGLTLLCLTLGLMAKPMLVTLPCVLLLLDHWPLNRTNPASTETPSPLSLPVVRLALEKVPFFTLAAVSGWLTFLAQQRGETVHSLKTIPLSARLANVSTAYLEYLSKTLAPARLTFFYPFTEQIPGWKIVAASFVIGGISILVARTWKTRPFQAVGWFWFLGTLVPVIGLVQVGDQALADRYTYLPHLGLFIAIIWTATGFISERQHLKVPLTAGATLGAALFLWLAWEQAQTWRDNVALYQHAIAINPTNAVAHFNLGVHFAESGAIEQAIVQYQAAIGVNPRYADASTNLGELLLQQGRAGEALTQLSWAVQLQPSAQRYFNLGTAFQKTGRLREASACYREALAYDPNFIQAHTNWGILLAEQGNIAAALEHFQTVIARQPDSAEAHHNLGFALENQNRWQEALPAYQKAVALEPNSDELHFKLGNALEKMGNRAEALQHFERVARLNPTYPNIQDRISAIKIPASTASTLPK
ncbi:MAG: tetratricopeptide repeat protein [Blastocatellia bacterium]|nr:tetratricopeptide repeat protein [Blastocatellia bacterium]